MTMRSTAQWAARVSQTGISRATIREMDDNHLCQECKQADVMHSETPTDFEVWHPLGVTSVPMKQEQQKQQQQDQGDGGGHGKFNKNQPKGKSAEAMMLYVNGQRAHPVAMVNDRRVRPYDMKPGEAAIYSADGSGQTVYHRVRNDGKDGLYMLTCDGPSQGEAGDGKGQNQSRTICMRHA